jgi:hypothetical protein
MEEDDSIALIPIAIKDLWMIEYALVFYLALLQQSKEPSVYDAMLIHTIHSLRKRIAAIPVAQEEEQLFSLTPEEATVILSAL